MSVPSYPLENDLTDVTEIEQDAAPSENQRPRTGRSLFVIIPLLVIGLVAAVFAVQLFLRGQTQPTNGPAPDFTLTTLQDETYSLSQLKGKVVVVNFWASWCAPCRVEAPELQAFWQKYKDKGVVLLGIAYTDTERGARAFLDEFKQTYPNGLDLGTRISSDYHITGVPETYVIDRQGSVTQFIMQPTDEETLSRLVDPLLTKQ